MKVHVFVKSTVTEFILNSIGFYESSSSLVQPLLTYQDNFLTWSMSQHSLFLY